MEGKSAKQTMLKIEQMVYGHRDQRIAVLGAFDTWPYMDFISRRLAEMDYMALTSRYIYRINKTNNKVVRVDNTPEPDVFMVDFLQQMILRCPRAVIIYSVPAGHYIETDWCYRNHINTLGIAFVRNIKDTCFDLAVFDEFGYSLCKGTKTAFDCIRSGSCPFKEQGISKNVIEYYLRAHAPNMLLTAVENIEVILPLLKLWLQKRLLNP